MKVTKTMQSVKEGDIGGVKSLSCSNMLATLTRNMQQRNLTAEQIALFQAEFLKANDVKVPDSYFGANNDFDDFIEEYMPKIKENIAGSTLYNDYVQWCKKNERPLVYGKFQCFTMLRAMGIMIPRGTVNGITIHNVVTPNVGVSKVE